ncbi:unnamed protein product, partial [marine sediment metagenome]
NNKLANMLIIWNERNNMVDINKEHSKQLLLIQKEYTEFENSFNNQNVKPITNKRITDWCDSIVELVDKLTTEKKFKSYKELNEFKQFYTKNQTKLTLLLSDILDEFDKIFPEIKRRLGILDSTWL